MTKFNLLKNDIPDKEQPNEDRYLLVRNGYQRFCIADNGERKQFHIDNQTNSIVFID